VWCWGDNFYGQIGDGTVIDRWVPVQLPSLSDATHIACGLYHSCALSVAGTVFCWGANGAGQVSGQGPGVPWTSAGSPVAVGNLPAAKTLAAGSYHTCSVAQNDTVWCWGWNTDGQLGDGTKTNKTSPVQATGLVGATLVKAGAGFSCALVSGGGLWCWGSNYYGQLADGTGVSHYAPAAAPGVSGLVSLGLGDYHGCAADSNGATWCWGNGSYGQLGNGAFSVWQSKPLVLSDFSGALAVAAGGSTSCALLPGNNLWCWGHNGGGQLGLGLTTKAVPVPVPNFP